jgi:hypothetical protein
MKTRLIILFFFIGLFSYAQTDSLPEGNKIVLDYVNTKIGKKIKTGICFDFVAEALDNVDPNWRKRTKRFHKPQYIYGKYIKRNKLLPGDIVLYEWRDVSINSKRRTSHVCIVYSIDKDGNIKVAEQNTEATLKKSIVIIDSFDPTGTDNETKIYNLKYYRPY